MIEAIIFDLNGVFIQSPKLSDRFNLDFGVAIEEFLPALKEIMDKVRRPGADGVFSYWAPYFEKWGIKMTEKEFEAYWFGAESENKQMTNLARELKARGMSLFILSNNFKERAEYYTNHFSFLNEIFNKVYYSWQTGFVKPNKECFELIIKENSLAPSECMYFDDSPKNIEVAQSLGFNAHLFQGSEEISKLLSIEL